MLIPHQNLNIRTADILKGTLNFITKNKSYESLNQYIPLKYRYWTSSGRNAIKLALKDIKAKRVGLPGFTCKVVDTAIRSAGCKPYYIDSSAIVNIKDIEQIINKIDTLIIPYNFGFLPEIDKIAVLCKKNHVTLIEDCAAALGAEYKDRLAGTFGDYSIYSFGISKGGFLGGMLASNNPVTETETQNYPTHELIKFSVQGIANHTIFNPKIYPLFVNKIRKNLKQEQRTLDYKPPRLGEYINLKILERHNKNLEIRRRNAKIITEELDGIIEFIKPLKDSNPSWLYFVFMVKNRNDFMKNLLKENIETIPLLDYKNLSNLKLSQEAFEKHTTLALYRPKSQIESTIKKIKKVCKNGNY